MTTCVQGAGPDLHAVTPDSGPADTASDFGGSSVMVDGVCKSYGSVRAVRNVSLDVAPGEFVALLGPSGSGKTTLFMTIAGFERPQSGSVVISGRDVTHVPAYRRGLGMVFQRYALFPHMTVGQNVGYPLKVRGVPLKKRRRMVSEALALVDLGPLSERRTSEISGGQQQRVALARALVFRPPVLLMDEPLGALDRQLREQLQLEIRRLHQELGTTILYVTHDQEEAMVMADRIAVMIDGELHQVGSPQELYCQPADALVAAFLGRTNLIDAEVVSVENNRAVVRIGDQSVRASRPSTSPEPADSIATGTRVRLCIRPERVAVTASQDGLRGRIREVIFTGAITFITVDLGFATVTSLVVGDECIQPLSVGQTVSVNWPDQHALIYPAS